MKKGLGLELAARCAGYRQAERRKPQGALSARLCGLPGSAAQRSPKKKTAAADVLRLWRGRGSWIVSAVPALERFDVEPAAPYFLAALFREAVRPVAAPAKTLVFDRKDGTFVTSLLESRGFGFKASSDKTAPADAVWLVDADGAPLDEGVKSAVRARCEKGGTVVLLNLVRDKVLDAACREQYAKRFEEAFRAAINRALRAQQSQLLALRRRRA